MKKSETSKFNDLSVKVGIFIRDRRRQLGMTQKELAKRVNLTPQQVQKYESGANSLRINRISDFDEALSCSIENFLIVLFDARQKVGKVVDLKEKEDDFVYRNVKLGKGKSGGLSVGSVENFLMKFIALKPDLQKSIVALVDNLSKKNKGRRGSRDKT
jgi:transcriptional regulator with XRE-family HTH domain